MAERNIEEPRRRPLPPPPRIRTNYPPDDEIYEEVNNYPEYRRPFDFRQSSQDGYPLQSDGGSSSEFHDTSRYQTPSETYINPSEYQGGLNEYDYTTNRGGHDVNEPEEYQNDMNPDVTQPRSDPEHSYDYCNDYRPRLTSNDVMRKTDRFKRKPNEFLAAFKSTHDEMRTDEETFIIVHLLKKNESNSPILDGNLYQLALLACCNSPQVVKRALDALLNEIFLSISNFSRFRCRNMLQAEKIIRQSFREFLKVDHMKAKCQRMTTYAWLIAFVLLRCSKEECVEIATEIKPIEKTLDTLLKENSERSTFRYGIYLARESIKRIVLLCGRKDSKESLHRSIERCANILNSKLEKNEVMELGKALNDEGSWVNLHVCLVFLQDLPKFHQFHGNVKPIILIQMLIRDYRDRCSASKLKSILKVPNSESWKFEVLVYHVMLRLIKTSENDEITEQVLMGKQGCGGVFSTWSKTKSKTTKDSFVMENLEKLCERAVFPAPPICFEQLITYNCKGDEQSFIENLSILRLTSIYKVLEILPKSDVHRGKQRVSNRSVVSTYDALMHGKKCVLKLYRHSKEEILKANTPTILPLRNEIEIVKVLNALAEPCPNLVQLLGSSIEAPMHMIIERGSKGDLLTYLKKRLNSTEAQSLVQIALDMCNAMIFLDSQNIIHRDLRAKNCFVFMQDGKLFVKLGDFHLAVLAYSGPRSTTSLKHRHNSATLTIKEHFPSRFAVPWMAVEALQFGEFSAASDVWSYGVLLFEIFTFGCQPYVNMPSGLSLDSDEEVREYVTNGNRLELHPKIPESIQVLIQLTMVDPDHRPTFSDLRDNLLGINFEDEIYADSSYFQISHGNESADIISQPINAGTGCSANGCFGECLNASDIAAPLNVDDSHFIREFIPATSYDILKLSELECPSLAIITDKIVHDEKLELVIEVGDMGSLEQFINEYGCSMENAMRYLLRIGEAVSFLHNRRFIHRNLRANSVFIYTNGDARLACFARVRKLKPNADHQSSTIPIHLPMPDDSLRWSSPEVIIDGEYSKASDMWAFGVLIWEMFTLIDKDLDESDEEITHLPYHQWTSKEQILSYLQQEKRLGQPNNCPDWLYEMMLRCWDHSTQDRAKSQDLVHCISEQIYQNNEHNTTHF